MNFLSQKWTRGDSTDQDSMEQIQGTHDHHTGVANIVSTSKGNNTQLQCFCHRNKQYIFTIILQNDTNIQFDFTYLYFLKQHVFALPALRSVFPFTFPRLHLPVGSTFLLTVRFTCPFRAALCIRSITYRWVLPATGIPSTYTNSSPGWRRPSRSAEPMAITAPMRI